MGIHFDISGLGNTNWRETGIRFLLGGAITVIAGLLAKKFGPVFGGLFLAFPAIFPASATLVEKHEQEKKRKAGIAFTNRGREAAALDAKGAALGAVGLICFAFVIWKLLPHWNAGPVLLTATVIWLGAAIALWRGSKLLVGAKMFKHR
jgi:hypothetical protein